MIDGPWELMTDWPHLLTPVGAVVAFSDAWMCRGGWRRALRGGSQFQVPRDIGSPSVNRAFGSKRSSSSPTRAGPVAAQLITGIPAPG